MTSPSADSATRPSLLLRLRDPADTASWQVFVTTYAPLIYGFCRKQGLQDADAADVAQEALVQVAQSMARFEYQPERGRFRGWLGTVVRHRLVRFWHAQDRADGAAGGGNWTQHLDQLEAPAADTEWDAEFNARVLQVALDQARPFFEPATWQAFEQVWLRQRSALETARELGVPIDMVYVSKSRVLKRLREEILLLAEDLPQCMPQS